MKPASAQRRPIDELARVLAAGAVVAAPALIGARLFTRVDGVICGGLIVETEAYTQEDPASHSHRGPTPRNEPMFGAPATAYVYFTYGMHECFNVVCAREGIGEAVLIRAIQPTIGIQEMIKRRRWQARPERQLCAGPARLCVALGITRAHNGVGLLDPAGEVWLEPRPANEPAPAIATSPRIGIRVGLDRPWRFVMAESPWVSRR